MADSILYQIKTPKVIEEGVSFEDFLDRYEGQSVEWHVGNVVQKVSNNERHQAIQMFLAFMLGYFLGIKNLGKIYQDGYQMQLNDNLPARQPDLLVVLNAHQDRIKHQYLDGAADIVIEIISPATGHIDRGEKYYQYQAGGIQEYWIIDPISKRVDVYYLDEDDNYQPILQNNNKIASQVLDGFVIDTTILWLDDLPNGAQVVDLVQNML